MRNNYNYGSENIMDNIEEVFGERNLLKIMFIPLLTDLPKNGYEWGT